MPEAAVVARARRPKRPALHWFGVDGSYFFFEVFFELVLFFDEEVFFEDADFLDGDAFFDEEVFFEDEVFFDDEAFFGDDVVFFEDDEAFFDEAFFDDDFGGGGTLPPARLASERPMAIACFLLVTFLPEPPLRSVPRLRSCIVFSTFSEAFFP